MLYQSEIGRTDLGTVIDHYWTAEDAGESEPVESAAPELLREFANALARGTHERMPEIDRLLQAHAQNWRLERMAVIDRLVLRLAVFELLWSDEVPDAVAISEALGLVRELSTDESPSFVNGILGQIARNKEQLTAEQ